MEVKRMSLNLALIVSFISFLLNHVHSYQLNNNLARNMYEIHQDIKRHISNIPILRFQTRQLLHLNNHKDVSELQPINFIGSSNYDLNLAANEIVEQAKRHQGIIEHATFAVVFVSTSYEAAFFNYSIISSVIKENLPNVQTILGCTTGCPIAPIGDFHQYPSELEARAGITAMFLSTNEANSYKFSAFHKTSDDILKYIKGDKETLGFDSSGINFILATDSIKSSLSKFCKALQEREGSNSFGTIASTITMLQQPKLFLSLPGNINMDKITNGIVGINIKGDLELKTYIAKSVSPVGPIFRVVEADGNTILNMQQVKGDNKAAAISPLEHLNTVLGEISAEDAASLKRELLVSVFPSPEGLSDAAIELLQTDILYGQKPVAFDPLTGSITIPQLLQGNVKLLSQERPLFRFCVRSSTVARQDLNVISNSIRKDALDSSLKGLEPAGLLVLGSVERGVKVFRVQDWETKAVYDAISESGERQIPAGGLFGSGAFAFIKTDDVSQRRSAIMEMDSLIAILTATKASKIRDQKKASASSEKRPINYLISQNDILSQKEKLESSDENDLVIVEKRDPESAHPVKVGTMDFFVPDKVPLPKNFLESLVWEREKEVDRLRERYAMNRALVIAKSSDGKFGVRNLPTFIRDLQNRSKSRATIKPLLMIELMRASVNNGAFPGDFSDATVSSKFLSDIAQNYISATAEGTLAAIGCNVDSGTYKGAFEDVETLKTTTKAVPIFCNDFINFGYQLFRAKAHGADAVKLLASSLPIGELSYLIKTARALTMTPIVVVSSKPQLLSVLKGVPNLEAVSVTSRNAKLWKIDVGKAGRILQDPEVKEAIEQFNRSNGEQKLLVFQEGFVSAEEVKACSDYGVDAVFLGEELLFNRERGVEQLLSTWIQ